MPERFDLGGAAFHLVIDSAKFGPVLSDAERQAREASQRIAAALAGIGRGSTGAPIAPRVNIAPATTALGQLGTQSRAAQQAASFTAAPKIDTRDAEARLNRLNQLAGAVGRGVIQGSGIGSGFLLGAGAGVGAIASLGVATAVSQLTQAITGSISAGIRYNSTFEQINNTLLHFTGSAESARQALAGFRKLDIESPFTEAQVQGAGATFIRASRGDIQRAQELTELTVQLAAAHPERSFEEMQAAIQQLISGDFQAFEDRVGIAFGTVRRLAAQGLTGMKLFAAAVKEAGVAPELFAKNAETFQARLSTLESNIQKFQRSLTKGGFDALSGEMDALNKSVERNAEGWGKLGEKVGAFAAEAFKGSGMALTLAAASQIGQFAAERLQPAPAAAGSAAAPFSADQLARQALTKQRDAAKEIQAQLKLNEDAAAKVKSEYEASIAPLQRQLDIINQPDFGIQQRQAQAQFSQAGAARLGEQALGPVGIRADVAGQRAALSLEREAIDIRQRRAGLAEQIGQAEQSIARRTAEVQIRAAEEGARAQQTGAQERQQARQDEITALQEETRLRRQGVADAVAGEREIADAARRGFEDRERSLDRANQRAQEFFRAEIDRLQEVNRLANQSRGPSASEIALRQLDARERARASAQTLAEARAAVKNANTRPERQQAQSRLAEIERQQAVDRQRATLEQRITAEREAADKARLAREEKIRQLEVQARDQDRAYQKEKEVRAERERLAEKTAADELRAAERTERTLQREEDNAVRELEKVDRGAARADQREITAALAAIASQRAGLQAGADSSGLANDQGNLERLRELAAIETQELDLRQKLLDGQGAFLSAAAAPEKVIADSAATLVGIEASQDAAIKALAAVSILEQLATFKTDFDAALTPIETKASELQQRLRDVNADITAAEGRLKQLQESQAPPASPPGETSGGEDFGGFLGRVFPGAGDLAKIPVPFSLTLPTPEQITAGASQIAQSLAGALQAPNIAELAGAASQALAQAIFGGISIHLADDDQTGKDVTKWVETSIVDPAFKALGAQSPSKVFEELAGFAADGFVKGASIWPQTIGPAMADAFRQAESQYVTPWFTNEFGPQAAATFASAAPLLNSASTQAALGAGMFGALQGGYEQYVIPWFTAGDGLAGQLDIHFAAAAAGIGGPAAVAAIGTSVSNAFTVGLNAGLRAERQWWDRFEIVGENLAISLANGFIGYFNANPLTSPTVRTGAYRDENPFPGRGMGGPVDPFRRYWVGEHGKEMFVSRTAGAILSHGDSIRTASTMDFSGLRSSSAAGPVGGSIGGSSRSLTIGNLTVQVPAGTTDPRGFATQIVRDVFSLMDAAERNAPDAAAATLAGA